MATDINIPYRCPNCGDSEKFTTLQELRTHLQTEHAFINDRSQRQISFSGINHGVFEHKFPQRSSLLELYHADARKLEEHLRKSKEDELNNKKLRNEYEGLTSSVLNVPKRKTFENCLPKATFREYGHSSRLNKHLYLKKLTNADKSSFENPYHQLQYSNDDSFKSDSNPFENRKLPVMDKQILEQMNEELVDSMASHSSGEIKSYKGVHFQATRNKLTDDKHVINTLNALSHDVLLERASQHATANSLFTTQEVLSGIEQAAEEKIARQQLVINSLAQELTEKEKRLENIMHEIESIHYQQLDSVEKVNLLKQKYDHEKRQLHQELHQKQVELDSLNKQITESKQSVIKGSETSFPAPANQSSDGSFGENKPINNHFHSPFSPVSSVSKHCGIEHIQNCSEEVTESLQYRLSLGESSNKEKELAVVKKKAQQLERDRQNLIMEMQSLLEAAAADNDKLRTELDSQTQKLSKLSCDLERSKQEQAELLDETSALYHQADVSLSILKTMLKEREHQLKSLSGSLEQAKTNQERLAMERDECLRLAKEREAMYKSLLAANSSQVNSIKEILESSQREKLKLKEGLSELRGKLAAKDEKDRQLTSKVSQLQAELAGKEKTQAELKEKIRRREEKLQKTKHEMERVRNYLETTAEKELEARSRLEAFISGLIDRAGKAESELHKLKYHQVPASSKKFSKEDEVLNLSHLPGVSSKAFLQSKFSSPEDLPDDKAACRLGCQRLPNQQKENLLQYHSTPKAAKYTTSPSYSRLPDKINNRGKQRPLHQQSPDVEIIYGQSVPPETSLYPSSSPHETSQLMFVNLPEVERMIQNVKKSTSTKPRDLVYSRKWHKIDEHRVEQLTSVNEEQNNGFLSIDDNGIMWEQTPPYLQKDARTDLRDNNSSLLRQRVEHLKMNDDTDVDEDLTDYLHEEHMSHEEWEEAENFLPESKRTSITKITKVGMAAFQKDPHLPDEKAVKLLSSLEPAVNNSSTEQTNSKNLYTDNLQEWKLRVETEQNETSQKIKFDALKAANDYSTTESSEISPLHKARTVQKRVEQLTSMNSSLPRYSSSKQSDGFEVSHLDRESDFSSSSYASFGQPPNLLKQEETKLYTTDEVCQASTDSDECVPNSPAVDKGKLNSKDSPEVIQRKDKTVNVRFSNETNQSCTEIAGNTCTNNFGHSAKNVSITEASDKNSVLEGDTFIEKEPANTFQEGIRESSNLSRDHVLDEDIGCHILQDPELAKYTDAAIRPAKELRARIISYSEAQFTSSEDDLIDDSESPQGQSLRKTSADASTDTDLEKLAMPGHLQKGFVIRKTVPNMKRLTHKKPKPKVPVRTFPSQESISLGPDELDNADRTKRQAVRKMRVALFRVFSFLDTRTLLTVSCVSKEWHRVSQHPTLWRHVSLADSSVSSEFLITLSKWCTQTRSLSLKGLRGRGIKAEESPENYQQAIRGSLELGLEKFLSACHDTITAIHITDCDNILTDKCLWLVSGYCRLLTILTYRSCMDPITPQLMWALGGGCPGITSLFVHPQQPCEKINAMNNKCLLLIAQLYQGIQELGLGGREFDRAGLLPLTQSCQQIKSLHFDYCLGITADLATAVCKAGLKHLHTLTISGTYVEAKAIQTFAENCRQLNRIHVSVSIQDCVDDPSKKKDKEIYKKIVKALEDLKMKSGFGIIFTLEATPVI